MGVTRRRTPVCLGLVLVVGANNTLYQVVSHHIGIIEISKRQPLNLFQDIGSLEQAMATLQAPPGATSERGACASSPCTGKASSPSRMMSMLARPTQATSWVGTVYKLSVRRPSRAARE